MSGLGRTAWCQPLVGRFLGRLFIGAHLLALKFGGILLYLFQTVRTHSVRGLDVESLREVSLHLKPLALVTDPAAPGANSHQALEVVEVVHQPFGEPED